MFATIATKWKPGLIKPGEPALTQQMTQSTSVPYFHGIFCKALNFWTNASTLECICNRYTCRNNFPSQALVILGVGVNTVKDAYE